MKLPLAILPLAAAGALLAGCGGMYGAGDVGYGYGYGGVGYAGPVALADCGGYYDGFYGPVDDGCWGNDGAFWYHGGDRQWHRDAGGHFNHQAMNGAREFHGRGPGAGHAFAGGGGRSGGDHSGGGHGGDDHHS